MKIVIEIDDNLYTRLFDNGVDNYDDAVDMATAIRKGTPLPKDHGEMKARDRMRTETEIKNRLEELEKIARKLNPDVIINNRVPLIHIKQEGLRTQIYELLWVLDLIG